MKVSAEDYEALKGFFAYMSEKWLRALPGLAPEDRPMAVLAQQEKQSMSLARKGLAMAIGDTIEMFDRAGPEEVDAFDRELGAAGLPTLSEVRARFSRQINGIMKRGKIRSEIEYYALRNAVDSMPEGDAAKAWHLLGEYETSGSPSRET